MGADMVTQGAVVSFFDQHMAVWDGVGQHDISCQLMVVRKGCMMARPPFRHSLSDLQAVRISTAAITIEICCISMHLSRNKFGLPAAPLAQHPLLQCDRDDALCEPPNYYEMRRQEGIRCLSMLSLRFDLSGVPHQNLRLQGLAEGVEGSRRTGGAEADRLGADVTATLPDAAPTVSHGYWHARSSRKLGMLTVLKHTYITCTEDITVLYAYMCT